MFTLTITFEAPDSLLARYEGNPSQFPIIHLMVLGQALLKDEDCHRYRWRGDTPRPGAVIVGEFEELGKAGLRWWWSGLLYPSEQIKAMGAFLMSQAQLLYLMNTLAQQRQAKTQPPTLIVPGGDMMGMGGWRGN